MTQMGGGGARPKHDVPAYKVVDLILRKGLRTLPPSRFSEAVALWWGVRFRPVPCVVRLRSGILISVDPSDYLQLLIYYLGTFEHHCLRYWRSCARDGRTVLDIGANIGLYTIEGGVAVGPTGNVLSIEPAPSNFHWLKANVELNHLRNVTLIEVAVGDVDKSSTLSLSSGANKGMFSLAPSLGGSSFAVKVKRIDDLLEERGVASVDLIKMDIEGSEYYALRGAMKTLQRSRPVIFIELNESALRDCKSSAKDIRELLYGLGYRGWVIGRTCLRRIESYLTHDCHECVFVHRDDREAMQNLGLSR